MQASDQDIQFEGLKKAFIKKGFTEEEFMSQMSELGKVILISALNQMFERKPPVRTLETAEEVTAYVEANFSKEDIRSIMDKESRQLSQKYIEEITKDST